MEPKTKNSPTTSNSSPKPKRARHPAPSYSAQDKAQAVLSVWTERSKASQICRQLKVNWITFDQWQRRAMEGMLQALEPRVKLTDGQALSPRLQALIRTQQQAHTRKLAQRLEQIQLAKPPEPAAQTP
jgi:transposase-like protein